MKIALYLSIIILIVSFLLSCTTTLKTDSDSVPENIFYFENFSDVEDGLIPEGWIGGSTIGVKNGNLTNFQDGNHSFTIPNIKFPENFILEIKMKNKSSCCGVIEFNIGNLSLGLNTNGESWLNESKFRIGKILFYVRPGDFLWINKTITVQLKKKGPVFKLFIDKKEFALCRLPNFNGSSITFKYGQFNQYENNFVIYNIVCYGLP